MTRRDLHDRRAGRRKSEPYGFSFCLRASVGLRSIVGTAERLLAKDCGRDRVNPPSSQANEMSLPPGKRGWERYARVELPRIVLVVRRPLIRLVCSHAKNWAANSAHELSFMMNPLCSVMKGFMVANPGRDRPCGRPPGQIPACGTTALGSCLGSWRRNARWGRDARCGQGAATDHRSG
jgi:hypothetical protein